MNRDGRRLQSIRYAGGAAPLPPECEVIMTHPVPAPVPAADATGTFSPDSVDILRPCVAGLDVHKMQITATVRLCDPQWHSYKAFVNDL